MRNKFMKFRQEKNRRIGERVKKIAFLALHLGFGGAEKAIVSEANFLVEKYDVEIICAYKLYEMPAFEVDNRVKIKYLSETIKPNKEELKIAIKKRKIVAILREGFVSLQVLCHRKLSMRRAIKVSDADIIISTRYLYHKLLGTCKKSNVITIAQEHNHHNGDEAYVKKIINSLNNINYFMPVSRELTDFYAERLGQTKCKYIPHSLEYIPDEVSELSEPSIVSIGRLSKEKGFVDLIDVFSLIAQEYPQWKLHIVGEGDERRAIETVIKEKNIEKNVVLHGYQRREYINKLLQKSSIYIMTSYTESFGIVLIEAQSFGIPCVVFDSARGALEIIKDQENGFVIANRDKEEMSAKIKQLIIDSNLRKQMGSNARDNSLKYAADNIKEQWFEFIDAI